MTVAMAKILQDETCRKLNLSLPLQRQYWCDGPLKALEQAAPSSWLSNYKAVAAFLKLGFGTYQYFMDSQNEDATMMQTRSLQVIASLGVHIHLDGRVFGDWNALSVELHKKQSAIRDAGQLMLPDIASSSVSLGLPRPQRSERYHFNEAQKTMLVGMARSSSEPMGNPESTKESVRLRYEKIAGALHATKLGLPIGDSRIDPLSPSDLRTLKHATAHWWYVRPSTKNRLSRVSSSRVSIFCLPYCPCPLCVCLIKVIRTQRRGHDAPRCQLNLDTRRYEAHRERQDAHEALARRRTHGHANGAPVRIAGSGWEVEIRQPQ